MFARSFSPKRIAKRMSIMDTRDMNTTQRIASASKSVQSARRSYWASVASDSPAWRIEAQAQALAIATERLVRECGGSTAKAQAAEVAYVDSLSA